MTFSNMRPYLTNFSSEFQILPLPLTAHPSTPQSSLTPQYCIGLLQCTYTDFLPLLKKLQLCPTLAVPVISRYRFLFFSSLYIQDDNIILIVNINCTFPTSLASFNCLSCERVWFLSASCSGVSPSLSGIFKFAPSRISN